MIFNIVHTHHHYHHPDAETIQRLRRIEQTLINYMESLMATIEELKAAVARNTSVDAGIVTLLTGLSQQLKDALAASDPAAIQAVIDQLDANTKTLSDAVTANTPAAAPPAGT